MTRVGWIRLAVIVAGIGALELVCRIGWIDRLTMPPPTLMAVYAYDVLASGRMTKDIFMTLQNVATAFVLAVSVGFLIGVVLHRLPRLRKAVDPLLASYYAVPIFIFYPLLIVIFGLNRWPLIAIAFLFAVVAMIINTLNGFDRVPKVLFRVARAHRMSRSAEVMLITLPSATPHLFTGVKLCVAYSFIGVVAGEFILSGAGIGYEIAFAYNNFDNRTMYGLMLLLLVFVAFLNISLHFWERRIHARRGGRI
jgi:NitT/TauT family transport system permease protein